MITKKTNREYKAFNLAYEYDNYTGEYKYAIATDLTEEELRSRYGDEISRYEPFLIISTEIGMTMIQSNNNENKHRMRVCRGEVLLVEEIANETNEYDDSIARANIEIRNELIMEAVNRLNEISRERIIMKYVYGYTEKEIADASGCSFQAVSKCIVRSLNELRGILTEMGVCA